jgi:hypothetical protein
VIWQISGFELKSDTNRWLFGDKRDLGKGWMKKVRPQGDLVQGSISESKISTKARERVQPLKLDLDNFRARVKRSIEALNNFRARVQPLIKPRLQHLQKGWLVTIVYTVAFAQHFTLAKEA